MNCSFNTGFKISNITIQQFLLSAKTHSQEADILFLRGWNKQDTQRHSADGCLYIALSKLSPPSFHTYHTDITDVSAITLPGKDFKLSRSTPGRRGAGGRQYDAQYKRNNTTLGTMQTD